MTSRYVSLASITAAIVFPVMSLVFFILFPGFIPGAACLIPILILSVLTIFKHRSNIRRLLNGTENRFEKEKKV